MKRLLFTGICIALGVALARAQSAQDQLARGTDLWNRRLANSAIAALQAAARDKKTAAEAHELLGRIYTFKGWQQDNVFPGWHDEPAYRDKAIAELNAAVAAAPDRASAKEALATAQRFAAADKVDPAPPRPEIRALDQKIAGFAAQPHASSDEFMALVQERLHAQADPGPYFVAAQILIEHGQYARGVALADDGARAADHFVDENLSAYQMAGKADGSKTRARAQATDLAGWAALLQKDYAAASTKLEEAERLSRGLDFNNQLHLAELAKARNEPARARDHYLNVLSLAGGFGGAPQGVRDGAKQALRAIYTDAEPFDAWLDRELAAKGDERKSTALKSLVDRKLPQLKLTTLDGKPFSTASLQGKVLLLNFFASW